MGTHCELNLYAPDFPAAERAARAAMQEIQRIEFRYSRYRPDSHLSQVNLVAQAGGSIEVDDETAGLLHYAFAAYHRSDGLFDITSGLLRRAWDFKSKRLAKQETLDQLLPRIGLSKVRWEAPILSFDSPGMELDLGGIGKEYAADRTAVVCIAQGIENGLIDLGGDIRVIGPHPDGQPWQIRIRHPLVQGDWLGTAAIHRGALATSGDYERCIEIKNRRYGHILHPETGWPVRGLCSVSVIADQCLLAGTLCTVAMLKGNMGAVWLEKLGVANLWMNDQGSSGQSLWPASSSVPVELISNQPSLVEVSC
jgi:thiamine biosynthesis lipoprotein